MLQFKKYLLEHQLYYLTEEIKSNDDKGKLHELLVAKHLSHEDETHRSLPKHFRDENKKTPAQVHDDIKSRISPEDYSLADSRAKDAADKIRTHFKSVHGVLPHHIGTVAWTSQKQDHEKLTKKKDPNSDADIMVHTIDDDGNHNYHGVSLKVGSGRPNLRNPGLANLDKLTGAKSSDTKQILSDHKNMLHSLGYDKSNSIESNHELYKAHKASPEGSAERIRADSADAHKLHTLKRLAKHYSTAANSLEPDKKKAILKELIAPNTHYNHFRVHTVTDKDGNLKHQHIEQHQQDLDKELANHNDLHFEHSGQTIKIHSKNPDGTKGKKLADISLKGVSGPIKGIAGATKSFMGGGSHD